MTYQNVTISLPDELLKQAKHLAVDEGVPLSHFIAGLVKEKIQQKTGYLEAKRRALARMERGTQLRLSPVTWTRDELHER